MLPTTRLFTARKIRSFLLIALLIFLIIPFEFVDAQTISVNTSTLNVRSGPGIEHNVVIKINEGEIYPILETNNEWVKIDVAGTTGWVANWLVTVNQTNSEHVNTNPNVTNPQEQYIDVIEAKAEELNVRTGPSTSFPAVDKISPGETYHILKKESDWIQIQLSTHLEGWVAGWLVDVKSVLRQETTTSNKSNATINADIVNVRSGPSTTFERIGQLTKGTTIEVRDIKDGWFLINFNGQDGWVAGQYANQSETNENNSGTQSGNANESNQDQQTGLNKTMIEVKTDLLNVRTGPSVEADVLLQLAKGSQVELLSRDGEWIELQLEDGKIGWVAAWLVTEISGEVGNQPTVKILNEGTNLRAGPSTSEPIVATARAGDVYPVTGTQGDWFEIQLNEKKKVFVAGWIVSAEGIPNVSRNPIQDVLKGKVIVVDAGHGGRDNGATGVNQKTKEKEVNLEVAKRLESKLRAAGATVIMSRDKDDYISLEDRVKISIKNNADAFISIHHNTFDQSSMNGSITFHYTNGRDKKLAEMIQAELTKQNGLKDLGARHGNFYVLRENPQLAVLVELGFLSNPTEELIIRTSKFQEDSAEGIFQGIVKYFK